MSAGPTNEKAAPVAPGRGHFSNNTSPANSAQQHTARKPTLKWKRFLAAVLESPKTSRELELAPVYDHVAHSTASEIRKKGIDLNTEIVTILGYGGEPSRIARYSIAPASRSKAVSLLEVL